MRRKIALLLVVSMVLSLLPAQFVSAQTKAGNAEIESVFAPRRIEASSPIARLSTLDDPVAVATPASITVTGAPAQRWAQNTDPGGSYVRAQFLFDVTTQNITATPASIGLNITDDRLLAYPDLTANTRVVSMTPPTGAAPVWEGVLDLEANGTGTLLLDFDFDLDPEDAPSGVWATILSIRFNVRTANGYEFHNIPVQLSVYLDPPSADDIQSVFVPNHRRIVQTNRLATNNFDIEANAIPAGDYDLAWFITRVQGGNQIIETSIPGLTFPNEININADGEATVAITGTPTAQAQGVWYVHLGVLTDDDWPVYHYIRLDIRSAAQQLPPPTPTPTPDPTTPAPAPSPSPTPEAPGDTTNVIVNNVTKVVISKTVVSTKVTTIINNAVVAGERPVIEINIGSGQDGIKVGGNDIQNIIINNGSLVLVQNSVKVQFTYTQMINWNINIDSEVVITMRPTPDREEKENVARRLRRKPGRKTTPQQVVDAMLTVLVEININIDGRVLTGAASRPTLSVDISDLTAEQLVNLKAVFFFLEDPNDPDSLTYMIVNGRIEGDTFVFPAVAPEGWFTLMQIEVDIQVQIATNIRLQLGSTSVVQDGQTGASLSVAPFFARPGDQDSLMLPLRAMAEALGATVSWNAQLRIVTVVHINFNFSFNVDTPFPGPDMGEPELVDNHTFVPRRFMSEMMDVEIDYDEETGGIYITETPDEEAVECTGGCGTVCNPCRNNPLSMGHAQSCWSSPYNSGGPPWWEGPCECTC